MIAYLAWSVTMFHFISLLITLSYGWLMPATIFATHLQAALYIRPLLHLDNTPCYASLKFTSLGWYSVLYQFVFYCFTVTIHRLMSCTSYKYALRSPSPSPSN